jgi:transcriptional regulator with AAA-type ATPase domain
LLETPRKSAYSQGMPRCPCGHPWPRGPRMAPMAHHPTDALIGDAPAVAELRRQVRHLASFDAPRNPHVPTVLIEGETGTGKGLLARVIHDSGGRAAGPFVDVNCAAIPETMLEAELFGFEAGAFTDARRSKPGLFEAAASGTLFLDEVDALPIALQSKLLKAIEEKSIRRLGAVSSVRVDVKLVAATQSDRRSAAAAPTSRGWPSTSSPSTRRRTGCPRSDSTTAPAPGSGPARGPATCASSATSSSASRCSSPRPTSTLPRSSGCASR